MGIRISRLYGTDIYTDGANYLGKINDIILNLESGKVVRVTTEPLKNVSKEAARDILCKKSVLYKNVKSVGDIILVSHGGGNVDVVEEVEVEESAKAPKAGFSVPPRPKAVEHSSKKSR